jgi:hypothetical protein
MPHPKICVQIGTLKSTQVLFNVFDRSSCVRPTHSCSNHIYTSLRTALRTLFARNIYRSAEGVRVRSNLLLPTVPVRRISSRARSSSGFFPTSLSFLERS